ncbi:glycine zipper 2TM domain-containing protein [Janthinobacterium sp.]|uniref:glycine zipper 2TM domain-containing protein n=1 Tax=Janthinobacterium sp. TaxID=1871054 RepID=UPI00293D52AF|nr:glycine zipper 2TM domain-containing protein [Janthinobacterium sp.]
MNSTTIQTASRIHPLMAGAAISVTVLSLVGAAAIAGLLPTSRGAVAPADTAMTANSAPSAASLAQNAPQTAPAPVAHKPRVVHHTTQVAQASRSYNDERPYQQPAERQERQERQYQQAPQAAAPAQTNYVGIGTGAVIGGLLGNQVGGGRGKALATIAGVIGGGMLGNEAQKQIQQAPQR